MKLNMPVTVQIIEKALCKIFNHDVAFAIPPLHRPYAWTADQAGELLSDLLAALGNNSQPVEQIHPFFLGAVTLIKEEDPPDVDLVDGQQRLTALTILLAVLRAAVQSKSAAALAGFNYGEDDLIAGMSRYYDVKLPAGDAEFFQKYVCDEKGLYRLLQLDKASLTDSQRNIQASAKCFAVALANLSEAQRVLLLHYLMQRCFLVAVSSRDLDAAYHIFSVLNARGMDLRIINLIKSEMLGGASAEQQEMYARIWEDEEEETFQSLFAHIRMLYRKTRLRETALQEYRRYVQVPASRQKFIDDVLKPYFESLEIIRMASYQGGAGAPALNALFYWLNQIDNFDWVPPAVFYLSQNRNAADSLRRFFGDLERLAAGLMIIRADVNNRIKRYGRLLRAIGDQADLYGADSPLQLTPGEIGQITKTLNGDLYRLKRIRQYVLRRLDAVLSQEGTPGDHSVISVEQVLPQEPARESAWLAAFPDAEERKQFIHRLGNLVLLSRGKNMRAQNDDFDRKKEMYFAAGAGSSPFALTRQVLQMTEWTPAVIDQRQTNLLQKLKELWRL